MAGMHHFQTSPKYHFKLATYSLCPTRECRARAGAEDSKKIHQLYGNQLPI